MGNPDCLGGNKEGGRWMEMGVIGRGNEQRGEVGVSGLGGAGANQAIHWWLVTVWLL